MRSLFTACGLAAISLTACTQGSPETFAGFGEKPVLPEPKTSPIPTLNARQAVGWPAGVQPTAPQGFTVTRFAGDLAHPRWLLVLPNGDVLVSEASSEASSGGGIQGYVANSLQKKAGAIQKSPNRIMLLRDADGDGVAEMRTTFAEGLQRPFGMTLAGGKLYVANDNGVVSFPSVDGQTSVQGPGAKVFDLPGGPINHHWTKNVVASPDGSKLYATVGSNSNVGENGIEAEAGRAAIVEYPLPAGPARVFASGLRNPNGLDFEPATGLIWTAVNERDMLGDDLVPDYMTSVRDGDFFGWPYSYYGEHVDSRVKPARPDLVAKARAPDYALGPHTASLGLTFYRSDLFPARYKGGVLVGQHGSWNRRPPSGYRVVFIPFAGGKPSGPPEVFLTGFLNAKDEAQGRPVGVVVDKTGALLVADDVGKVVWRVAPTR